MKTNTNKQQGEESLNTLLNLTSTKETQEQKHERIKAEVLSEVFK